MTDSLSTKLLNLIDANEKALSTLNRLAKAAYQRLNGLEPLDRADALPSELDIHPVISVDGNDVGDFVRLKDLMHQQFYQIEDSQKEQAFLSGLSTGFRDLDEMTGGLHPAELIVLAARPSMGKTALALNIACNVAKQQQQVAIFSMELTGEQLAQRLICTEARVNLDCVHVCMVSDDDLAQLGHAVERMGNYPICINDDALLTVTEIAEKARRLKEQAGLGLIIVDYLQAIEPEDEIVQRQNETKIAHGLRMLADELQVPVIVLSQVSRSVESRFPRRPQLPDLLGFRALAKSADMVWFLYRPGYYGDEEIIDAFIYSPSQRKILKRMNSKKRCPVLAPYRNRTEFIVAKNRRGPNGNIQLIWKPEHGLFEDQEEWRPAPRSI